MLARVSNSGIRSSLPVSLRSRRLRGLGAGSQLVGGAVATGLTFVPVVGPILGPLVGIISSIFGAHAAKVAQEANDLNSAVPAYYVGLQAIVAAASNGQLSAAEAQGYVDQAVATYYAQVAPIIKKGQACTINTDCSGPGGWSGGPVNFSPCNGPCSMGCNFIEPAACQVKQLLAGGGGTMQLETPTGSVNGFNGLQPVSVTYTPPVQTPSASPADVTSANSISVGDAVAAATQAVAGGGISPLFLIGGGLAALALLKAIL
jgi:hypothetical protein